MRVALITDEPRVTGIGKYAHNLSRELRQIGVDADLYFVKWRSHEVDAQLEAGRLVRPTPFSLPSTSLEAVIAHWRRESLFPRDYDVYHAVQQFLIPLLPSRGASIATIHDLRPFVLSGEYPFLLRRALRRALRSASQLDLVITDSQSTSSDVARLTAIAKDKVVVIPLGHGPEFRPGKRVRNELGIPDDATVLLNVGTEDSSKNIPFLLQVASSLQRRLPNLRLVRVGKRKDSTGALIDSLGLGGRVQYASNITDEQLAMYYNSADLLLHPSLYEGFGLPPVEAMASGCPVVCSDMSSLPEVVGDAGLVLPLDASRWVDEIERLLRNSDQMERYRALGLERARSFTWASCAEKTARGYREVLAQGDMR